MWWTEKSTLSYKKFGCKGEKIMRPAWIEIDLNALRKNIRNLKACVSKNADFMGVIKADGYGHGAIKVAEILKQEGINRFAVVMMEEGIALRRAGYAEPILILGHTQEEDFEKTLEYELTPIVYKYSQAVQLNKIAEEMKTKAVVHIKIDTGMSRLGFTPEYKSVETIKEISKFRNLLIEGIYTHLATADQIKSDFVKKQFETFKEVLNGLEKDGVHIPIKHMANSAATINFPEMHFDMVRPGTSLYGLYPGPEMSAKPTVELHPVMAIKAKLVHIKSVDTGTPVSYGGRFVTQRPSVLGVVPMGYVDGVFRQLANKGEVLIRGKRCTIVGTICMDQFMVDITELNEVEIGDEVVLVGQQGCDRITADEVGANAGTISIEVVTRIGSRMPVIYRE